MVEEKRGAPRRSLSDERRGTASFAPGALVRSEPAPAPTGQAPSSRPANSLHELGRRDGEASRARQMAASTHGCKEGIRQRGGTKSFRNFFRRTVRPPQPGNGTTPVRAK